MYILRVGLHAINLGVKFRIFECIFFTWDFMPSILELNFDLQDVLLALIAFWGP